MIYIVDTRYQLTPNSLKSIDAAARRWKCDYYIQRRGNFIYEKLRGFTHTFAKKLLILDADVVIREDTPSPLDFPSLSGVANVDCDFEEYVITESIHHTGTDIEGIKDNYKIIESCPYDYFNTGFLVIDREDKNILDETIELLDKIGKRQINFEQSALNYVIDAFGKERNYLENTWNYRRKEFEKKMNKYVYHFAGHKNRYEKTKNIDWRI